MKGKKLDYMPIGKRTRLQRFRRENGLTERNKRARLAARSKRRKIYAEKNDQNVTNNDDGDDDEEDVKVVDESEYLRRVYFLGFRDCSPNMFMGMEEISDVSDVQLVGEGRAPLSADVDNDNVKVDGYEGSDDRKEECHSWGMNPGSEAKGGVGDGCKSLPIQPGSVSENDNYSGTSSDEEDDDDHKLSDEDFQVDETERSTVFSSEYSSSDGSEEGGKRKVKSRNNEGDEVASVNVSDVDNDSVDGDDNCLKKTKENIYDHELNLKWLFKSGEYGGNENQCESPKKSNVAPEQEPNSNRGNFENAGKRKRGRPPKNSNGAIDSSLQMKKRVRKLKPSEAENIMLNTILENGSAGLESSVHVSQKSTSLPLKFRFGVQNSLPEISKEAQDLENLFNDLEFALRTCDIGAETSFLDENDDVNAGTSAVLQENLCHEGKHYLIHDDEIGIRCKYCSFVKLEIRYVTPAFYKNPFGTSKNKNYGRFPSDNANANASDSFHLPESKDDPQNTHSDNTQGSVWELIPGIVDTLYPHQQEGFEFMWKNIGGGIKLDELGNPTKFGSGGCIICHAPGTGKTRLAITFLQSFVRKYPTSKPVIIAPKSMLLTWEEEFARWNIDIPLININKTELSGNEDLEVLNHAENVKPQQTIRIAKLYTWATGKGILGISYTLFEKLAGDRKGVDMKIRRVLLEWPGIIVLDEGHTARNDHSNIWNVLTEVQTKRRIMLSGTPFQNNFEELLNTLLLVREEFGNPLLPGKYMKRGRNLTERRGLMDCNVDNDRRIAKLKNMMKPFVHVHKGEILKKTLRGLFHSVVLLKPSDLQKTCFKQLGGLKKGLKLDHLVSIASVHPSLLYNCEEIPGFVKVLLKEHRKNLDAGVKIRFLFELINLAQGEKVLVFSQFLTPLKFIANLLKTRYNWAEEKELLYMDGKQDVKQRQAFIRHFNNPKSEARVLLASTKACSEGIHLVGASRVVLLDVVWNPSVERQAISRAYRLGQQKDVFVYHLITSGTQEEDKYYWQVTKDRVSEKVFSSEERNKDERMLPRVSEDRILEEMIQNEKIKSMFAKIIYQPKADELIDSFDPVNM